jgi:putative ABC transport system permease protein
MHTGMFSHLFKLIWNKKKQNFLLIVEMFVSFLVMFAVFTLIVFYYNNYRKPVGFGYQHVWAITYQLPEFDRNFNPDSAMQLQQRVKQVVRSIPDVQDATFASGNIPYSFNTMNQNLTHKGKKLLVHNYQVEDNYADFFGVKIIEGRFFSKQDDAANGTPIVINQQLREEMFGKEEVIGKRIGSNEEMKIIGVIDNMKDKGDYESHGPGMYRRTDTSNAHFAGTLLVSVSPGATAETENRLYKSISQALDASNVEIEHLTAKRVRKNNFTLVPMIILLIVAGFLIINVALGLFGVLWYNINKRRSEIGLRRAIGATGNSISRQLIAESLLLSTLSIILGCFFAVQFPLLNVFDLPAGIYIAAILLSVLFIYILVIACSLYPGKQAAAIYPAVALHEE